MFRFLAVFALVLTLPFTAFALPIAGQPSTPDSGPTGWSPPPSPANALPTPEGGAIINVDTEAVYASIQDAITAATPGATLEILSSVHSEGLVVIDRAVTLRGANGDATIMAATDTGDSGDARAWFLVQSGVRLDVQDLTFDGAGFSIHQVFRHRGYGSFDNVRFRDIQFNPSGPNYAGSAIVAFGDGPVDVRNSHFSQIGRQGIFYFGSALTGSIAENNTYLGKGTGDFLDYGIEVGGGADVILRGNTISGCRGEASVDGADSAAILVSTFFGPGTAALIESNSLTDSTAGLLVGYAGQPESSVVTASFNRIVGNDLGLQSGSSSPVAAENNWWGCNDGPDATGCDTLDGTGTIQTDPYLILSLAASATVLQVGETATLKAELFRNNQGGDTSSWATVPDGIDAIFDGGSLGTVAPAVNTTQSGAADSVFSAGTAGTDLVSTTIDGQVVSLSITVEGGGTPLLFVREEIPGVTGEQVVVPVEFGGSGLDISAVAWSTDYDETCLDFDPTDADLDGIPDAIEFVTSAEFVPTVFVDLTDSDGELDILLADIGLPLATLPDGVLANITFTVVCDPGIGTVLAPVGFSSAPAASFGNNQGQDVPGTSTDGSVLVLSGLRGDCNGDGFVSAGDISACTLEVFDGDGSFWLDVPNSTFVGNPVGCDANADTLVDAGDVSCKGRIIFDLPCDNSLVELGGSTKPSWGLSYHLNAEDGIVDLPITLSNDSGQALSSTVFSLRLDGQRVRFDDRDEDGNGVPDAVTFSGNASLVSVFLDPNDSDVVHVLLADLAQTPSLLTDGDRLTLDLEVLPGVTDVQGATAFRSATPVSFGTPLGASIQGYGEVVGSEVFRDGFESGDAGAWSSTGGTFMHPWMLPTKCTLVIHAKDLYGEPKLELDVEALP